MLKEETRSLSGYVIGIISLVSAFFQPLMGLIFGIIALIGVRKLKNAVAKRARILSIIGIIVGVILFAASIYLMIKNGQLNLPTA